MKNQKGITLVALIITIIVMVILAAVIIVSAVADGGIIDRAEGAIRENERADVQEIIIGSYVFKVTASANTLAYLDLDKTGIAIYENLTANGFTVIGATEAKDESGNDITDENGDPVKTAPIKNGENNEKIIDIEVEGNHGVYEGTVESNGLAGGIIVKENVSEETEKSENPESSIPENEEVVWGENSSLAAGMLFYIGESNNLVVSTEGNKVEKCILAADGTIKRTEEIRELNFQNYNRINFQFAQNIESINFNNQLPSDIILDLHSKVNLKEVKGLEGLEKFEDYDGRLGYF